MLITSISETFIYPLQVVGAEKRNVRIATYAPNKKIYETPHRSDTTFIREMSDQNKLVLKYTRRLCQHVKHDSGIPRYCNINIPG